MGTLSGFQDFFLQPIIKDPAQYEREVGGNGIIGYHYLGVILVVNSEKKESKIGRRAGIRIVIFMPIAIVIVIGQLCEDRFIHCTHKCELCSPVKIGL